MLHKQQLNRNEVVAYKGFHEVHLIETELKGRIVKRERLILKDSVGAIVIDETGKMGLVSQKRPIVSEQMWEIPAGVLDKDLNYEQTMIEELYEECMIQKDEIISISKPLYTYYTLPSSSEAKFYLLIINVLEQTSKLNLEDRDVDEVKWFSKKELKAMLLNKVFKDAKTILSVQHFLLHHNDE